MQPISNSSGFIQAHTQTYTHRHTQKLAKSVFERNWQGQQREQFIRTEQQSAVKASESKGELQQEKVSLETNHVLCVLLWN